MFCFVSFCICLCLSQSSDLGSRLKFLTCEMSWIVGGDSSWNHPVISFHDNKIVDFDFFFFLLLVLSEVLCDSDVASGIVFI